MELPLSLLIAGLAAVAAVAAAAIGALVLSRLAELSGRQAQAFTRVDDQIAMAARDTRHETAARLDALGAALEQRLDASMGRIAAEIAALRAETRAAADAHRASADAQRASADLLRDSLRDALHQGFANARAESGQQLADMAARQEQQSTAFRGQMDTLRAGIETAVHHLRVSVDERLRELQQQTATQLEQMRHTVDEKLQATLDARLGESFRQVSERLEQVYKGLGEMQALATGVGDLKRVLANVKSRGTWGEVQLENLLEQALAREQYEANVATTPGSGERVEFAVRLPGRTGLASDTVWLPIDAKFPLEDYQALIEASDRGDADGVDEAGKRLETRVKACAKEIGSKYVNVPLTTDFAILFLPVEGLYAEVLRRPGLVDAIQREHRVMLAGPTTLWALLSSLQMGFRTLAIERRSSEVWATLGAVKTEFGKFGKVLDHVQQHLQRASSKIDDARKGTRSIERKLVHVQQLPAADAAGLLDGLVPMLDDDLLVTVEGEAH